MKSLIGWGAKPVDSHVNEKPTNNGHCSVN